MIPFLFVVWGICAVINLTILTYGYIMTVHNESPLSVIGSYLTFVVVAPWVTWQLLSKLFHGEM